MKPTILCVLLVLGGCGKPCYKPLPSQEVPDAFSPGHPSVYNMGDPMDRFYEYPDKKLCGQIMPDITNSGIWLGYTVADVDDYDPKQFIRSWNNSRQFASHNRDEVIKWVEDYCYVGRKGDSR